MRRDTASGPYGGPKPCSYLVGGKTGEDSSQIVVFHEERRHMLLHRILARFKIVIDGRLQFSNLRLVRADLPFSARPASFDV